MMTVISGGWTPGPIRGFQRWSEAGRVAVVADRWVEAVSNMGLAEDGSLWRALNSKAPGAEPLEESPNAFEPERGSEIGRESRKDLRDKTREGLRAPDEPHGRGPTIVVPIPGSDSRLHLRPVRHGGWFGGVLGNAMLGLRRPIDELRVTASLAERGAPVPSPALVIAERSGPFWNATVGTVFEPDTVDGIAFLSGSPDRGAVIRAAAAAGRAVSCFHRQGGSHADLHIGNLLIRIKPDGETEVVVIDLDRARDLEPVDSSQRMRELMRLQRSLIKRRFVQTVGARGLARFLAEYTGGDRRLRRELLSHLGRERLRIALHAVLYPAPP
jgi:3-deoxy-D-manno-octulosonic acid kinase